MPCEIVKNFTCEKSNTVRIYKRSGGNSGLLVTFVTGGPHFFCPDGSLPESLFAESIAPFSIPALLAVMIRIFLALFISVTTLLADVGKWEPEISAFEKADVRKGGILFTGSSTIRLWKSLERDFADLPVLNRGFGGSKMQDSVDFAERIVVPQEPRMVVLFAGTNDIAAGKSPEDVAKSFEAWVAKMKEKLPKTELCFLEITTSPSRWEQRDKVIAANQLIKPMCEKTGVKFIAIREKFFGADGTPRAELFVADRLHLNADGYKILADTVRPFLPKP